MQQHRWLWVILLIGGLYRLTSLTDGSLYKFGLDWDELNVLALAKLPLTQLFEVGFKRDFHPAGTWLVLHGWIKLFGDSDVAVRLFAWFIGMLGIGASYALGWHITRSIKIAVLIGLFSISSPWLWSYGHLANNHSIHWVFALWSWFFLLRRNLTVYFFTAAIAIHASANGVLLLLYQGTYLLWIREVTRSLLIVAGLLLLTWLPYAWQIIQPWHISHASEFNNGHEKVPVLAMLLSPLNLLFSGPQFQYNLPLSLSSLGLGMGVGMIGLLILIIRRIKPVPLWFCLTILPILLTGLLHLLIFQPHGSKGIFHLRTLLPCTFGLHWLLAFWITKPSKRLIQTGLTLIILLTQIFLQWKTDFRPELWPTWGKFIAQNIQPGDGILVYPGYYYLSLSKYVTPDQFGLSQQERNFDPSHENLFHQINRSDDLFFALTGRDVLSKPQTQRQILEFIEKHPRIWLIISEDKKHFLPLFTCPKTYIFPLNNEQFKMHHCD